MTSMNVHSAPDHPATAESLLYIASRLPELSETFVYREVLGLRGRGYSVVAASVRMPRSFPGNPDINALSDGVFVVYSAATLAALPFALLRHPALALGALHDSVWADHPSLSSRLKHVFQAMMGLAAGVRLQRHQIGHVHAHMAHVPATVGLYLARALGARFSFTGHAADLFVDRAALVFKLKHAAFVSCISHWHRDFYQSVAAGTFERRPIVRCSVALPQDIHDERPEIVTVARLVSKKGVDLLIDAFAAADLAGWSLRIIGDGPDRVALEARARRLGVAERVVFEGPQPHGRCLEAIADSGLFVLPCRTAANGDKDGIPVVLMEAMAAARAVIAGDLPAIRELIEDEISGLLVVPDDAAALASAIGRLAGDDHLRRTLGAKARSHIETEFSDAVNLDRLCAAFDRARAAE